MEQPLPAERHWRIEGLVREHRVMCVSTLPEPMGASEVTIEPDLGGPGYGRRLECTHAVLVEAGSGR